MILNASFDQPVSTYFDLLFGLAFDDDGTQGESVVGQSVFLTNTYSNGLQERASFTNLADGSVRLGDADIFGPGGQSLFNLALGDLSIVVSDTAELDISQVVDRVRVTFSAADDVVPLDRSLDISETRGNRTESVLVFEGVLPVDFDFGAGEDHAVLDAARADVQVTARGDVFDLTTATATGSLAGLEVLEFNDGMLLLDEGGDYADYTYALYAAALSRTPDADGFRFWNGVMNDGGFGGATRDDAELGLAAEFVRAPEFTQRFDVSTNTAFVNALYVNVLDREADRGGFDFWLDAFDTGELGRDDMLRFFAASDENQTRIADDIDAGYWVL